MVITLKVLKALHLVRGTRFQFFLPINERIWEIRMSNAGCWKVDNAIHRINHCPVDSVVCFVNAYPLDSDLSGG